MHHHLVLSSTNIDLFPWLNRTPSHLLRVFSSEKSLTIISSTITNFLTIFISSPHRLTQLKRSFSYSFSVVNCINMKSILFWLTIFSLVMLISFNQAMPMDDHDQDAIHFIKQWLSLRQNHRNNHPQNIPLDSDLIWPVADNENDRERRFGNTRYGRSVWNQSSHPIEKSFLFILSFHASSCFRMFHQQ